MKSYEGKAPKKTYHPPRLLSYGDLRKLTQVIKGGPDFDDAQKMNMGMS